MQHDAEPMKYGRFEFLVLSVGFLAIGTTLILEFRGTPSAEEIIAQLMLFGVLVTAVRWGRTGGFIGTMLASLAYLMLRIPLVLSEHALTADVAMLILVRVVSYGLVGIAGGELCTRIKYVFAKSSHSGRIDEWSGIYNQRAIVRALESAGGQYSRYDTPYSLVLIELAPALIGELRVSRQRALVRGVANHLRGNVRLIDETGRLDDGRFIVVLPQTPLAGARIVADRLAAGTVNTLGAKGESVIVTALGTPEDAGALVELRSRLQAPYLEADLIESPEAGDQAVSGS